MNTNENKATTFALESGESIQSALVQIANNLGDCDDAADLAEIVAKLDRAVNEYSALNAVAEDLQLLKRYHDEQMFICGCDDQPEVDNLKARISRHLAQLSTLHNKA